MRKHKKKLIAAVFILAVLVYAWFYGGNYSQFSGDRGQETGDRVQGTVGSSAAATPRSELNSESEPNSEFGIRNSESNSEAEELESSSVTSSEPDKDVSLVSGSTVADKPENSTTTNDNSIPISESPIPNSEVDRITSNDSSVPNSESQIPDSDDGSFTVYLTIRCDTILNNMDMLSREKHELVPADGVILPTTAALAYEGESAFNVLQRETRRARIHMASRFTPFYNSAYIEAINNLYEMDVGELSGWMYKVNDSFPSYGSTRYLLEPGDTVELHYSCDLGRDLGQTGFDGWQRD